jgi:hypothetical protein
MCSAANRINPWKYPTVARCSAWNRIESDSLQSKGCGYRQEWRVNNP